ncbi:MAG: hypothetical protein WBA73_20785 [Devosia sp.]
MSDPAPQREAILTALDRLLAWPEISRSPQLGKFLAYIVQRTLEGNEQAIKAYSIAVDVFGRAADFDPQADPIVRVQARRLRALLDDYYRGSGVGEVIQIRLPVGRYVPDFVAVPEPGESVVESDPPEARAGWPRWTFSASWFALAFIALGLAMTAYALNAWRGGAGASGAVQRPTITVVEFQNLANATTPPPVVAGLAIELVTDLEAFGNIGARYGGGGETNIAVSNLPTSDYVLTGIVRYDDDEVQYSAILTDSRSSSVVWNHTLAVPASDAAGSTVLDTVSKSLSLVLGSPRGPLHVAARRFLASDVSTSGQINPYLCRVLFDLYRETGNGSEAERAIACYAALPDAERDSAAVLAATSILVTEQGAAASTMGGQTSPEPLRVAAVNLERAIGLDPISGFVWEQQARLHEAQGALAMARADFSSSVQLNPASVDALAEYARLLALGGNLAQAEPMAREAAEASPNPPPWYQGVPALLALRDGDFARAIACAELYAEADHELGPILAIMAAQQSGDRAVVNRYLPQVLDMASFRAKGVLPRLRERIGDEMLMNSIRSALIQAGVPPTALIRSF